MCGIYYGSLKLKVDGISLSSLQKHVWPLMKGGCGKELWFGDLALPIVPC